jgi:tRNA-specific 2-thiouridylase
VSRVDPVTNTITLGRREDLETTSFTIDDVGFIDDAAPRTASGAFRAAVRIRHRAVPIGATIRPVDDGQPARGGRWLVETDGPVWAIAPGQAAVLYDGEACLGGGRIARAAAPAAHPARSAGSSATPADRPTTAPGRDRVPVA